MKTSCYTALLKTNGITLRPGIARLMHQAHEAGVLLAIATTTSRQNVDALLRAAIPLPPFHTIAAGDEVSAKKPAPDIYQLALTRLDRPAACCVAVEDTLNGLRSAHAAGLSCIITRSVYGGDGPFPGALAIVDDLDTPFVSLARIEAWRAG
jgi:HAD superfamily hydrolase (TIGR01509 family)